MAINLLKLITPSTYKNYDLVYKSMAISVSWGVGDR